MTELLSITPPQSRAGRGLINWTVYQLTEAANLAAGDVEQFEAGAGNAEQAIARAIRSALEDGGVLILPEEGGEGAGVRLKFPQQTVKRIQTWEGEGGTTGEDDIA